MRENRSASVCPVCPHHCRLTEGQLGRCGARRNEKGKIVCDNYGKITALALDPIEKKPLRQFLPGSLILSVGSMCLSQTALRRFPCWKNSFHILMR